ncbi:MAG: GNAT family N-acetyltransferase [Nanoarchaeales archaeon]|nr:GNAT family N-acetyltransferase [Nanoarchaeales archaeon]
MELRKFKLGDEKSISKLHEETIRTINSKDYSNEQIETWPGILDNYSNLLKTLQNNISYVVELDNIIVGFGDMGHSGEIFRLYTHKDYQGKGIASKILEKLEKEAKNLNLNKITLESSLTAKSFYESKGYKIIKKVHSKINDVKHEEWKMEKIL